MFCSNESLRLSCCVVTGMIAGAIVVSIGCAERPASLSSADEARGSQPAAVATGVSPQNALNAPLAQAVVGTWLGQAILDESALEKKLEQLPVAEQERVFVIAENFLSTVMAMDVRNDGTIESEVEMQPLGERAIRDSTIGQWRATQMDADELAVELAELTQDNSTIVTKRNFRFYPDRNAFVMSVPVPAELEGCQAMMIFERQSAVANVAQGPENAQR